MKQHTWLETAWGPVLLEWTERGLARCCLPEGSQPEPHDSLPGSLPGTLEPVAAWLQSYFAGEQLPLPCFPRDLEQVRPASEAVYAATLAVPYGQVRTYGQIAGACNKPGAARWVGGVLGRNPWPPLVPCHRIVAAGGKLGGFSSLRGLETKRRLLSLEGALLC